MWPSMLKGATPEGAATRTQFFRSLEQWIRYDFKVLAVPETINLGGGGLLASACSCTRV